MGWAYRCPAIDLDTPNEYGKPTRCELAAHDRKDQHRRGDHTWTYPEGTFIGLAFGHPDYREKVDT